MLDALLGTDVALGALKGLLVARTEANPLFLEESVRSLAETGALAGERGTYRLTRPIEQLKMPATVQAILAARVDRLAPEAKRLLQAAAAIGKNFALPLLLAITDAQEPEVRAGLTSLQAAEFLYEVKLSPDQEYTFKHALTHEVTYSGLLHERRRELHARIVDAIESLYRDRLDEHIERLAHHAFSGALREKAVHYLRQAGIKAAARSALADARARFEQAISVLEALPESQSKQEKAFETRLELRPVLNLLGELRRSLERQCEAEVLAERLNDDRRRALVCTFMTNIHSLLGEPDEALATGSRALKIAGRLGDLRLRLRATTYLEQAHYMRGDYRRVIELATDNLAALPVDLIYEYFGMPAPVSVYDRTWLALSLAQLGRLSEGEVHEKEAIQLAEPTHHAFTVGMAYRAAGIIRLVKGDWDTARSRIEHGLAVDRTGNVALMLPLDIALLGRVLAELGKTTEAVNLLHEAEKYHEHLLASDYPYRGTSVYFELGRSSLLLGRLDEARSLADRAVELSGRHPGFAARALHLLGDIATHPDRFDGKSAKVYYRKALALAESREMRPLIAQCHLGLGKVNRFTCRRDQVLKHLTMAIMMYREMGMAYWLEQSEAELRQLG